MKQHIISSTTPKQLNEILRNGEKEGWKAQGSLVYGLIDDVPAYSILIVKTAKKGITKRFVPPTLIEVKEYILEKKFGVDANTWINFYQSKNWMVGKVKMKDWKACIRTWQYKTQNSKDPLNIPQPKQFTASKIDESKKVSPGRIQKLKNMSATELYNATGQLPKD